MEAPELLLLPQPTERPDVRRRRRPDPSPDSLVPRVERAWREASRAQRQLRALLDNVREGVVALCTQGRITYANATAAALLRRDPPELVGLEANALQALPRDARPGAAGVADVDTFRRADGSGLPVEWRCTELDDGSRVLVFRDATERMRMRLERDILRQRSDQTRPPRDPAVHAPGRLVFIHGDACTRARVGEALWRAGWTASLAESARAALGERASGPVAAVVLAAPPDATLLHEIRAVYPDVPVMLWLAEAAPAARHTLGATSAP
jgi:hypothetical protein